MPPRLPWLLLALAVAGGSYGFWLNDEADQAAALLSMSHGSLHVEPQSTRTYAIGDNVSMERRWDDTPVASTALNLLALPVIPILILADSLAPLSLWFGATFTVAAWKAMGIPWPSNAPRPLVAWATFVGFMVLVEQGFRVSGPDVPYFIALIALQVTNLLLAGLCAWLLYGLISMEVESRLGRSVALMASLGASWLFWAQGLKYHMLAATCVAGLLYLATRPRTMRRDAAIGFVAGFSAWVNPVVGVVSFLALAVVELGRMARRSGRRSQILRQWAIMAVGALLGMAPMFAENAYLFGNPLTGFYVAGAGAGNQTGDPGPATFAFVNVLLSILQWQGWGDFLLNLASILTWGGRVEGNPFGIFLLTPFLAASLFGVFSLVRSRRSSEAQRLAVGLLFFQTILMTNAAVRQGAGLDVRLWFHMLPAFAVLACVGARRFLEALGNRTAITTRALVFLVAAIGALVVLGSSHLRLGPSLGHHFQYAFIAIFAAGAIWVAFAWAWTILRPGRRDMALAVTAAALVAIPLAWGALFLVAQHTNIPHTGSHEGAGMLVPVMDSISSLLRDAIDPPQPIGLVFDGNGTLLYHPDHGRCDVVPNPCPDVSMPEDLRRALEALNNGTATA